MGLIVFDAMTETELLNGFVSLFVGRGDCYGSEEGGCIRKPLNHDVFDNHLRGVSAIGVYPAIPARVPFCMWGCIDIDVEDLDAAKLMRRTLEHANITAWIERSRSKGYHVWTFAASPVPARSMRNTLLLAHQVANYPAREVNPKQHDVTVHKVGNYVRLPYYGGINMTPTRRVILDYNDNPLPLDEFVPLAIQTRVNASRFNELAELYREPEKPRQVFDFSNLENESLDDALRAASPLARIIWRDGPLQGQDRSTALIRLAHVCRSSGITPSMTTVIVCDADRRWGKFLARGESGMREIEKIIELAFRN